jgi:3-methyladenine DNA glycosylase AlkC
VRSWAAYLLAASPDFSLGERLQLTRPLANDHNPGVREWAWLALRPQVAANILLAIDLLEPWTVSTSPFLRRFAAEATRPRGFWSVHIEALVHTPKLGLPILEPLRADPHQYVQDSVSNWLNDASRSHPEFVRELCARWLEESPSPATERICKRAQRSLE